MLIFRLERFNMKLWNDLSGEQRRFYFQKISLVKKVPNVAQQPATLL